MSDDYTDPLKDLEDRGVLPKLADPPPASDPLQELESRGVLPELTPPPPGQTPQSAGASAPDPLADLEASGVLPKLEQEQAQPRPELLRRLRPGPPDDPLRMKDLPPPEEFGKGLQRGLSGVVSTGILAGAAVAELFGAEESAESLARKALAAEKDIAQKYPQGVEFKNAFESPENFVNYFSSLLGEQIPNIASIVATGGLGQILGRVVGRRIAQREADEIIREATKRAAARRGATAGTVAGASALETGGIVGEQYGATGRIDPGAALVAGTAAGMLEAVTPALLIRRLGLTQGEATSFLNHALRKLETVARSKPGIFASYALGGAGTEGATELLQEGIAIAARDYVDENFSTLDPARREEIVARLTEAAVSGALIGGTFGGAVGAVAPSVDMRGLGLEDVARRLDDEEAAAQRARLSTAFAYNTAGAGAPEIFNTESGTPLVSFVRAEDFVGDTIEQAVATGHSPEVDIDSFDRYRVDIESVAPEDITAGLRDLPSTLELNFENPRVQFLDPELRDQALEAAQNAVALFDLGSYDNRGEGESEYARAIDLGFRFRPDRSDSFILIGDAAQRRDFIRDEGAFVPPSSLMRGNVYIPAAGTFGSDYSVILSPDEALVEAKNRTREGGAYHVDMRRIPREKLSNIGLKELKERLPEEALESNEAFRAAIDADPYIEFQAIDDDAEIEAMQERALTKLRADVKRWSLKEPSGVLEVRDVAKLLNAFDPNVEGSILVRGRIPERALTLIPFAPRWSRRTHDDPYTPEVNSVRFLEQLDSSVTLDGAEYDTGKHEFGTVQVLIDKNIERVPAEIEKAKKVGKLYQELLDKYKIKKRKLVLFVNGMPQFGFTPNSGYNFFYYGSGAWDTAAISLDFSDQFTEIELAGTAAHELGHYIAFTEWEGMEAGQQGKLLAAYDRFLVKAFLARSLNEFQFIYKDAAGPGITSFPYEAQGDPLSFTQSLLDLEGAGRSRGPDYWFSFDEWFAEQMARYATTQAPALSYLEKFFKGIGERVLEVIRFFADRFGFYDPKAFEPAEEFRNYIDSLAQRNVAPVFQTGVEAPHAQSELDADQALKDLGIKGVAAQPEGVEIEPLMEAVGVPKKQRERFRAVSDRISWFSKWGLSLQQLAQRNQHIAGLQLYREYIDRWRIERMKILTESDLTVRDWSALGPVRAEKVGRMLFAVDNMEYLTQEEIEREVIRQPTAEEEAALAQQLGLDEGAFEMYLEVRDQLKRFIDSMEEAVLYDVEAMVRENAGDNAIVDELLQIERARVRAEFNALRRAPYFPHMRFGNFIVAAKDTEGVTVYSSQFDTKREADKAALKLRGKYPEQTHSISVDRVPEAAKTLAGLPPTVLKALKNRLNLSDEQESQLDAFIAEHLPSRSFTQRLLRRKNVEGYSTDAMRSYASYFFHGAGYLARLKWGGRLADSIQVMEEEKRDLKRGRGRSVVNDVSKRTQIIDFVRDHLQHVMDPKPDWAQLRSAAFMWHLGFSPKSALINLTQIPLVTGPYLGARFGDAKALNALRKATTGFQRTWARERGDLETRDDRFFEMVNLGISQGFLNESLARELAEVATGHNLQRLLPGSEVSRKWRMLSYWGAYMFQTAEKFNRSVTFRAAIDLAMAEPQNPYLFELERENQLQAEELTKQGWNPVEIRAFLAGRDAVRKTQFEYQREARPRFMRGKAGTLLTFYMFTQNMLFFATNQPGRGRYLLAMLFAAGVMGLPGAEDAAEIAKYIARRLYGKEFDLEKEVRELVIALMGEDPAVPPDLVLHGVSRVGFGIPQAADLVGIPIPEFDLSASIGLGSIVPGVGELGRQGSFEDKFASVTTDIAGATFGTGINILKAMSDDRLPVDDFKRWERAMPAALRNTSRAYRFAIEGKERTRSGADVVVFDASDPKHLMEAIFAGAGFTSTRVARKWDREIMKIEVQNFWAAQRQALMAQFDQADALPPGAFKGRPAKADVLDAIKAYNKSVPYRSLIIRPSELRQSKRGRIRDRKLFERGFGGGRRNVPISRDINRLFPEVER